MGVPKRLVMMLSLPRCGTHFIWSRFVRSGRFQLIYDADRVPALHVLARTHCVPLQFLSSTTVNPNYNFQYNSLVEVRRVLTARGHLDWLSARYRASSDQDLFERSLDAQDERGKTLFSVNRFVYTTSYDMLPGCPWNIEQAATALKLLHAWLRDSPHEVTWAMVIRPLPNWLRSQLLLYGPTRTNLILRRARETPVVVELCLELGIPLFWMADAMASVSSGDFALQTCAPVSAAAVRTFLDDCRAAEQVDVAAWRPVRIGRILDYLRERDPITRTSLVRSIGAFPLRVSRFVPVLGRRVREDYEGVALNNARIVL